MKLRTKTVRVGFIFLAIFLCVLVLLPQIVQASTVTATVPVGHLPYAVAFTLDSKYAYVACVDRVSVINTASNKVTTTIKIGGCVDIAITPDGKYAYVTNSVSLANGYDNFVSVISTETNKVTATISLGGTPTGVAITPNGAYAYVTENDLINNEGVGMVYVISTATNKVTTKITVYGSPSAVAIAPSGEYAYVVSQGSASSVGGIVNGTVSVISTSSNTVDATVTVGSGPSAVAIAPNGDYAYVTDGDNEVSVIDTAKNTITATVTGLNTPNGVALAPDGAYAYVTNADSANGGYGTVSVINTATNTVDDTLTVGMNAYGIAIAPNGEYVYVTNFDDGTVSVISTGINTAPTTSESPQTPEFAAQWLTVALLIFIIIVLGMIITVKNLRKKNSLKTSDENQTLPNQPNQSSEIHTFFFNF